MFSPCIHRIHQIQNKKNTYAACIAPIKAPALNPIFSGGLNDSEFRKFAYLNTPPLHNTPFAVTFNATVSAVPVIMLNFGLKNQ